MENAHGLAAVAILESLLDTLVQKEVVARDEARTLMTGSAWLRDAPARPKLTRLWETSSNGSCKAARPVRTNFRQPSFRSLAVCAGARRDAYMPSPSRCG